jgi:hypothetical protein
MKRFGYQRSRLLFLACSKRRVLLIGSTFLTKSLQSGEWTITHGHQITIPYIGYAGDFPLLLQVSGSNRF